MSTVETNGIETYYKREGDGPPVILVHGGNSDLQLWQHQVDGLVDDYEVIRYDLRGHGRTGGSDIDRYSVGLFADDLYALVEELGLETPRICGLSLGGMTALTYAARYPDDISALAVAGAPTPEFPSVKERVLRLGLGRVVLTLIDVVGYERIQSANEWIAERFGEDVDEVKDEATKLREETFETDPDEYTKILRAVNTYSQTPIVMENINVPTLVLYGEEEPFIESHLPVYRRRIPDVVVREIPDAGHNSHIQNPDAFTRAIREFFDEQVSMEKVVDS